MQGQFFGKLLLSEVQSHIFHLQIQNYAAHMAIGEYYEGISDLTDSLIEQCQGTHDIIYTNYAFESIINLQNNIKLTPANVQLVIEYFAELKDYLITNKLNVFSENDTHLLNILDEIVSLISKTIYKLKFLK